MTIKYLPYVFLALAVLGEVFGTSLVKDTEGFSKWKPTVVMFFCYGVSFYFLSLTVKTIPVGVVYAIWSGLGILLIALIAVYKYQQIPNFGTMVGMGFIIVGVALVSVMSSPEH